MKMGYDNQTRNSSGTVIAIILLLVFAVFGGLIVLGVGGWFFLRGSRMERVVMVERDQAIRAEEVARAMAEKAAAAQAPAAQAFKAAAEFEREVLGETVPGPQLTIELSKEGQLKLNGEAVALPALIDSLKASAADETTSLTIDVRADRECSFQHVAIVIASCQELGITRFRIRTLEQSAEQESPENDEPATVVK
jgi:biopolymer transport protein ExbD